MSEPPVPLRIDDIVDCFEGAVPAVIATVSAAGTPNITYLSKVRLVGDERVALSNQFFSKTARNLAENPRASLLVVDPTTYDEFRLTLVYERTERRGPVFERLREDVDTIAALQGMQDVFKLRAADVYRVVDVEKVLAAVDYRDETFVVDHRTRSEVLDPERMAAMTARLNRAADLDTLLDSALTGLAELFGYEYSSLLLVDEGGRRLYTIASHGYEGQGLGSEVLIGDGIVGMAATRCEPVTVGDFRQLERYSRAVRRSYEDSGAIGPGREIPVPGLPAAQSRVAVPAMAFGELVGVLTVESVQPVAYGPGDEAVLSAVASLVAHAVEVGRARGGAEEESVTAVAPTGVAPPPGTRSVNVRFFPVDGSTFIDGDYLIKGVAGRILWSLLGQHESDGRVEFTNREMRLDPALELPAFRDNFEARLILLTRRLDERAAPIRIDKTGRGRFRLVVNAPLVLEARPSEQ
jgi:adenylate cyclase